MILVTHFTLIPLDNYNNDEGREFYNSRPFALIYYIPEANGLKKDQVTLLPGPFFILSIILHMFCM